MRKILLISFLSLSVFTQLNAQNVNIPDTNFKAYLVGETLINTNGDTEIQVSEAAAFTGMIKCDNLFITDLTGIEAFVSLKNLDCQYNNLTHLNVSANTALTYLACGENQLTTLNVSANPNLIQLYCAYNKLTTLDLDSNISLAAINCQDNLLNSLNLANGHNNIISHLKAHNNPNLACIRVDDSTYSVSQWVGSSYQFDSDIIFSTTCGSTSGINKSDLITLSIYPNPANDMINIHTDATIISSLIYDFSGSLVAIFKGHEYSVSHLNSGLYLINVDTKSGIAQHKFVKQ